MKTSGTSPIISKKIKKSMNPKNVLLINSSNKLLSREDNLHSNESLVPSLGLAMVAASLRKVGFEVKIIDLRLKHRSLEDVLKYIEKESPLFVGFGAFTNEIIQSAECAKLIKLKYPDLKIVIGGPHATTLPKLTLEEFPSFDYAVIGEGETISIKIANFIHKGDYKSLEKLKNIAYRKSGKIKIKYDPRGIIEDIDALPFPAWDLFELAHYNNIFVVSTSRGCPYQCYFCNPLYLGKRIRMRRVEKVIEELKMLKDKFGVKRVQFADAAFNLNINRTRILCEEMIKNNLDIDWDCETRADNLNEEILNKMRSAGCKWIAIGVESGSEKLLKEVIHKGETKEQIENGVHLIKKAKIKVRCFFILGHYMETKKEIRETIRFALKLKPDALSFGLMVPNPGSEIRKLAEKNLGGMKILSNNWSNYNQFDYDCYEQGNMSITELKKWQARAYWTFYLHNPLKALSLLIDESSYNYQFTSVLTLPITLLKRLLG